MPKKVIETPRLIMREIVPEDLERMFLLDSNPEVMHYIGVAPLTKLEESEEIIRKIRKQYEENGIGRWAVVEKESGLLIGWSGLKYLTEEINGYKNVYDLGYRFLPEYWGKGYATEAGKAFVEYSFEEMNLPVIYAYAHCGNDGSNKILKKLGLNSVGKFVDDLDGAECYWYELKKEDYKK